MEEDEAGDQHLSKGAAAGGCEASRWLAMALTLLGCLTSWKPVGMADAEGEWRWPAAATGRCWCWSLLRDSMTGGGGGGALVPGGPLYRRSCPVVMIMMV